MENIIKDLKQQREKAEQRFIEFSIANRQITQGFTEPDTSSYLDKIIELNDAIAVLENYIMSAAQEE